MSELPKGWIDTTLGSVCDARAGIGFPTDMQGRDSGEVPFCKVSDISFSVLNNAEKLGSARHYISEDEVANLKGKLLPIGSTVFAKIGEALKLNRRAITTKPLLVDNNVMGLVPFDEVILSKYLFYFMKTVRLEGISNATTVPAVRKSDIETITIPLAPLNEQKRIVAKLDELLPKIEACKQRLEKIPTILKRLRQSVLADAVSGRLTAEWREQNKSICPASSLINRIMSERSKKSGKRQEVFDIDTSLADMYELPPSWEWVALGNYAECSRGRFSVRPRNDPTCYNGKYPFIQIGDLPRNGGLIAAHNQTLNDKGLSVSKLFPKGTVAIAIVGATIGNTGILGYDMCFPDSLVGLETGTPAGNIYVDFYLRLVKERIRAISYAGGGQPNIKLETLNPYPFPLAPLEEQAEIVRIVGEKLAFIDRCENRLLSILGCVDKVGSSILSKAFSGCLVSQDPSDEPASLLLERIKSSASTPKQKKTPSGKRKVAKEPQSLSA